MDLPPLANDFSSSAASPAPVFRCERQGDVLSAYRVLAHLESFYPGFSAWFAQKVIPGCVDGSRAVLAAIDTKTGRMLGVAVVKRTHSERKICTLYVRPHCAGRGYGIRLLREAMVWLDHPRPIITVGASRLQNFNPLFARYGFEITSKIDDLYIAGEPEYVFNDFAGVHVGGMLQQPIGSDHSSDVKHLGTSAMARPYAPPPAMRSRVSWIEA